jgi:hypothetical protein
MNQTQEISMKTSQWFVAALVTFSTIPLIAQQSGASAQQSTAAAAGNTSVSQASSASLRPVSGELAGKLDAKSSKVGDQVVVKTTDTARMAEGVVIPKGSKIVGHITEVQAHSSSQQDSHVTVQFDRAELKDGRSMAIRTVIVSVSPSQAALAAAANGNTDDAQYAGAGMPMGSVGGGVTGGGRGGLGGAVGAAGGTVGGAANTAGAIGTNANSTLGAAGTGLGAAGNATGNLGAASAGLSGELSGAASAPVHATALPGLMLAGDASGSTSGTLSASKRNVHLDGGTQLVLGVSVAGDQK